MVACAVRARAGGRGASVPGIGSKFRFKASLAAGVALFLGEGAAFAQVPPAQPVAPTREQVQPPPTQTVPQPARLTVEGEIEHAPCALDRPDYQNIRFTLRDVVFDNLRGLPAARLRAAYADHVGQENNVALICEIRDRAAAILREAGYVAAVEVPEQRIADGVVHFQVLMAKLVGIRVRGNAGRGERMIARYLGKLTEQEVFNRYDAERYLLLAGDLPGYSVRLALRSAGAARGEVIGEVIVEHVPVLADVTVQNLGSESLGRWGGLARLQIFGLTGLGDRTTLAVFSTADTHEQQTVQVGHELRIGGEGLTLGGQLTYSWARPDLGNPAIDIVSHTLFATLDAAYPFVRRQRENLRGEIGLDWIDQDIAFNTLPLNRDRLRVAYARLSFDARGLVARDPHYTLAEPRWRLAGDVELRRGLDIFNATQGCGPALVNCLAPGAVPPTRFEGDPTATLVRGDLEGEFRPVPRVTIALGMRGQYSRDPLLSFEEFSAGNYTIGRGYDPGALLGDSGLGVQAELRFGSAAPTTDTQFRAQPYVFVDQAWVWNRDRIFAIPEEELTSVGGGVRAAFGARFRLDLLVAAPLDRAPLQARKSDPRILVTFTTRLWPWRSR